MNLGPIDPPDDIVCCHSWVLVRVPGTLPDPAWKPPWQAIQLDVGVSLQGKLKWLTLNRRRCDGVGMCKLPCCTYKY